jgi:HSP20 family protein
MLNQRFFSVPTFGPFRAFDELNRMRRQMDRLMDTFRDRPAYGPGAGVFPAINLTEDEDKYFLRAELPGVQVSDLEITATGKNLTISGERKLDVEDASAKYHRREREGGRFSRILTMPKEIDVDRIEARMTNGILTLRVPKAESAKPRRISIGS